MVRQNILKSSLHSKRLILNSVLLIIFIASCVIFSHQQNSYTLTSEQLAKKESQGLSEKVLAATEKNEKVRVLVTLTKPEHYVDVAKTPDQIKSNSAIISAQTDTILAKVPQGSFENVKKFVTTPVIALDLNSSALQKLKSLREVAMIEENHIGRTFSDETSQTRKQIRVDVSDTVENVYNLTGDGTYVAVVDNGVDINESQNRLDGTVVDPDYQICIGQTSGPDQTCPSEAIDGGLFQSLGNDAYLGHKIARVHPCFPKICDTHGNGVSDVLAGQETATVSAGIARKTKIIPIKIHPISYEGMTQALDIVIQLNAGLVQTQSGTDFVVPDNKFNNKIAAVNYSIGAWQATESQQCSWSNMTNAVNTLNSLGIFTVTNPGGQGPREGGAAADKIAIPGCTPGVFIAGASTDSTDTRAVLVGKELLGWQTNRAPTFPNYLAVPAHRMRYLAILPSGLSELIYAPDMPPTQSNSTPVMSGLLALTKEATTRSKINLTYNQALDLYTKTGLPIIDEGYFIDERFGYEDGTIDEQDGQDDFFTEDPYVSGPAVSVLDAQYPNTEASSEKSVIYRGEIEIPSNDNYTITAGSADGVKVWMDGELRLDNWIDRNYEENTSYPIYLEGGKRYPIIVAYYNIHLSGSLNVTVKDSSGNPLPSSQFYSANTGSAGGLEASHYNKKVNIYPRVDFKNAMAKYYRDYAVLNDDTSLCVTNSNNLYLVCAHDSKGVFEDPNPEASPSAFVPEFGKMVLVTFNYSPSVANADAHITYASYCGQALTKIGDTAVGGGMKTEMWYRTNPEAVNCEAYAQFNKFAGERAASVTLFNNIASTDPIMETHTEGSTSSTYTVDPTYVNVDLEGSNDTMMVCGYSHYSEQTTPPGSNTVTVNGITRQLWKYENPYIPDNNGNSTGQLANVWAGLVATSQRTSNGQSLRMSWDFAKTMPWSTVCANVKIKHLGSEPIIGPSATPVPTPVPTPSPTPTPTPTPTVTPSPIPTPTHTPSATPAPVVTLKANGKTGPVTVPYNKPVTLSWATTDSNTTCTASNAWTGSKASNGSEYTANLTTNKVYVLTCVGPGGTTVQNLDVTVQTGPVIDFKVNGSNTVTLDNGIAPALSWSVVGATSCTASGDWSGTKAATSGMEKANVISANTSYTLSCTGSSITRTATVTVTSTGSAAVNGYRAKYFADTNFQPQTYIGTEVKTTISHDSDYAAIYPGMPLNYFSARYTAQITPPTTGVYTFQTLSDNRVRLYIDDTAVISNWPTHGRTYDTGTMTLTSGKTYNVVLEFADESSTATIGFYSSVNGAPVNLNAKAVDLPLNSVNGNGLHANYTKNSNSVMTKIEPLIDNLWTWGTTSQLPNLYSNVEYSGKIVPTTTATYTFQYPVGAQVWINNVLKGSGSFAQAMTANVAYNIKVSIPFDIWEYKYMYLNWKKGTESYKPVDSKYLRP